MAKHKKKRRRQVTHAQVKAVLLAIVILVVAIIVLIVSAATPEEPETPTTPTTTTATTVVTTTATTSMYTTKKTTTAAVQADDTCWLDEKGLLQFKTDGYYVQPNGVSDWKLMLVNDWNGMPSDYESTVSFVSVGSQKVDSRILEDLQAMLTAGKAYGIGVQSG